MTTTRMIRGLRSNVACAPQKTAASECTPERGWASLPDTAQCKFLGVRYIALDEMIENPAAKDGGESHGKGLQNVLFDLWGILFPDHGRETYRRLEGDDTTPITAYKSGNRYYVADGGNSLATAHYLGHAFVLAQVWELP